MAGTNSWIIYKTPSVKRRSLISSISVFPACGYNLARLPIWSANSLKSAFERLRPRGRLATFTAYIGGIELILIAAEAITRKFGSASAADSIGGWTAFLGFILFILATILAIRWFRSHVLWSVRNRLLVTYLFVGAVPVMLALALAVGSGYLVLEHLATFLAVSEIQAQEQRLSTANAAAADLIAHHGVTPDQIMANDTVFSGRSIMNLPVRIAPGWLTDGFTGLVDDKGQLYLRAANKITTSQGELVVISSVPFDQKFLSRVAANLGTLTVYTRPVEIDDRSGVKVRKIDNRPEAHVSDEQARDRDTSQFISAGSVGAQRFSLDREFSFGGLVQTRNWSDGSNDPIFNKFLTGTTRLSTIYSFLTASMGVWTGVVGTILFVVSIAFALVVLIALLIGIRLTRTITYSVANLYKATQHINRGEFDHRIEVKELDQLAALQKSFNSMTESLQRLIIEQKEKERLQSELEIAHEVQAQLFPPAISGTGTLDLYGTCQPARTVSGDYYDFLSYGPEQMGIAVGDISGKGISAALLMATIHSAVRAYEQEQLFAVGADSAKALAAGGQGGVLTRSAIALPSPAHMLWLLNRHLYRSTQPEKYATLFLGFYDGDTHRLTYSNAGHLAPIILGQDGSLRRLEAGGMVVGLFDNMEYQEETVELRKGDIFIAFSDGMTEPENEFGEFGEDRLMEAISASSDQPLDRISGHAIAAVKDWIGATEQPDDITLVLARRIA
jgi:phosphoserine phosphatase RsbU/P